MREGGRKTEPTFNKYKTKPHMQRKLISSGSIFEQNAAYSRAVVAGNMVFVAGCTGYDYTAGTISPDLLEQTDQCFRNIQYALEQADSSLNDVVRVTYIFKDMANFEKCWPVFRQYFSDVRPAATAFQANMVNDDILIEIEVTAVKE